MESVFEIVIKYLQYFVFWYPFLLSLLWISGATIFYFLIEKNLDKDLDISKYEWPKISILIPCYNEEETIEETIKNICELSYPNFEVIAVNDGSVDNTRKILMNLCRKYKKLRVVDCKENHGKANALHIAAHESTSEYLLCVDSDALLEDKTPYYLIQHFLEEGEQVGAVTGNPRIRNRDTLLSRMQLVEYASIIGTIKRSQVILGKVMTVSGVIVAYRKKALIDAGLWDRKIITEDIAISWKLQREFWEIRYEPRALCWMLVPETLKGIYNQRVRWSQGGQEVILKHWDIFTDWKQRRMWPIYIEQVVSILWAYAWVFMTIYMLATATALSQLLIWFSFNSFSLVMLSHIQLLISISNESKYDNIIKYYLYAAWYPSIYWMINTIVVISATPKAIISSIKGGYAIWDSPDRGNRADL